MVGQLLDDTTQSGPDRPWEPHRRAATDLSQVFLKLFDLAGELQARNDESAVELCARFFVAFV